MLAVVPARAHSRGLPGKNLARVAGRSLVERALRVALDVPGIHAVVATSDDPEVLAVARSVGAEALERPTELAADDTSTAAVVEHVVASRPAVGTIVLLQPTSPLREPGDVRRCLEAVHAGAPAAVTVTEVEHPVEWSVHLGEHGELVPATSWQALRTRRQDLPRAYRPDGACYVVTRAFFEAHGEFIGPGTVGVVMPRERSVDVDDAVDLALARLLAEREQPRTT